MVIDSAPVHPAHHRSAGLRIASAGQSHTDAPMTKRYACRYAALVSMSSSSTVSGRLATSGLAEVASSEASLRRFLHGLPGIDAVGLQARAAGLGTRSIK